MSGSEDPVLQRIARFWDARAREDALRYSVPGGGRVPVERFDAAGEAVHAELERLVGWSSSRAGTVLDLGCGAGRLTRALADRADEVVACDVSSRMIAAARERLGAVDNVVWRTEHGGDLHGTGAESVDAAVALGVLTHLPTVDLVAGVLAELARVLRPGAPAVFDVRSQAPPLVLPGEDDLPAHVVAHPLWHGVVVDLETLAAVAHDEGLVLERIEGSGTARCLVLARRDDA